MAVVRSPDFLRALIRETALATLIHQRRLTPSCGGHAPTAERTVGPARMIAESLTPKPGIREQNLPQAVIPRSRRSIRASTICSQRIGLPGTHATHATASGGGRTTSLASLRRFWEIGERGTSF